MMVARLLLVALALLGAVITGTVVLDQQSVPPQPACTTNYPFVICE